MRPLDAGSARLITLKNVVLPAPFGPMMPVIDPAATAKSTSSTARSPPNDLLSRCASSSIIAASPAPGRGRVSERIAPARPAGMKRINSTSARPKITIWYCCSTASTCDSP